jgi:hypothetical protein
LPLELAVRPLLLLELLLLLRELVLAAQLLSTVVRLLPARVGPSVSLLAQEPSHLVLLISRPLLLLLEEL